ncbi:MAG: hypothetical protein IPN26_01610 [Bacteroidetes bacterium]|nr:hypothetical protein [Bacteroidota bacterium]
MKLSVKLYVQWYNHQRFRYLAGWRWMCIIKGPVIWFLLKRPIIDSINLNNNLSVSSNIVYNLLRNTFSWIIDR